MTGTSGSPTAGISIDRPAVALLDELEQTLVSHIRRDNSSCKIASAARRRAARSRVTSPRQRTVRPGPGTAAAKPSTQAAAPPQPPPRL
jgi:hypothetical protein